MLKKIFLSTVLILTACNSNAALKVGVTAGPHAMIMEKVKEEAKKQGLDIEITEFSDFVLPNRALEDGDLDANSMQHQPYLDDQIKTRGYQFSAVGKTVLMPMGIYSSSLKKIDDLKEGAKIGIPNDPSNGARALKLLEKAGVIKLKSVDMPTILDITENPKKVSIVELEAPQILRSLDDVACAITNSDWVVLVNVDPKSALLQEDKNSPYANLIAVKTSRKDEADIKKLVEIYQSAPVKEYITTQFKGAVIPAF